MQKRLIGLVASVVLAGGAASSGCSSSSVGQSPGSGGKQGSGGTTASGGTVGGGSGGNGSGGATGSGGGSGAPPSCPPATPCSGSVMGSWTVMSSCLALSGDIDGHAASLGCSKVPITGSLEVTGTWTANADGTYTDDTVTKGSIKFSLAKDCLSVSSVPVSCEKAGGSFEGLGWSNVSCSTDSSGLCNCSASA
ncbi:MAG TPA: hypothetical protein VIU64_07770, partial [Polyangia bacterium]